MNTYIDYTNVFRDVGIDLISLYFFSYKILYRRYHKTELFVICSLFNIFMLLVIMALVRTTFSVAVGFGLFALLSMLTLRSTPFKKAEMAYMFGGIVLAVINGAGITDLVFVFTCNITIILSAVVISSWSIVNCANMDVILDRVDPDALKNHDVMKDKLRRMFNVDITEFSIQRVDYVKDLMEITIAYLVNPAATSGLADQERPFAHTVGQLDRGALPIRKPTYDAQ